jgi:hypothetical protein
MTPRCLAERCVKVLFSGLQLTAHGVGGGFHGGGGFHAAGGFHGGGGFAGGFRGGGGGHGGGGHR